MPWGLPPLPANMPSATEVPGTKAPPPTPAEKARVRRIEELAEEALRLEMDAMGVSSFVDLKARNDNAQVLYAASRTVLEAVRRERARLQFEVDASEWELVNRA